MEMIKAPINKSFKAFFPEDDVKTLDSIESIDIEVCEREDVSDIRIEVDGIKAGEKLCALLSRLVSVADFINNLPEDYGNELLERS